MAVINQLGEKQISLKNTGYRELPSAKLGVLRGMFLIPRGTEIATADLAVAQATYETGMKDVLSDRWFYIPLWDAFTDKSTEDIYVETLQGQKFAEQGKYAFQVMIEANKNVSGALRSFNSKQWSAIFFDESASLIGMTPDGTKVRGIE